MPIRVLLVGDNALFREGLSQILRSDGRFRVTGEAPTGRASVTDAVRLKPDLIIMDLGIPVASDIDAIARIRLNDPSVPIGILTSLDSDEQIRLALKAGGSDYICKDATIGELLETAVRWANGEPHVPNSSQGKATPAATRSEPRELLASLTPRELDVLRALSSGASMGSIAARFGIRRKTLRNHISSAYHKLGIYDRAQAVIIALHEGLVELP